jgi:hypothetical protein
MRSVRFRGYQLTPSYQAAGYHLATSCADKRAVEEVERDRRGDLASAQTAIAMRPGRDLSRGAAFP